MRRTEIEFDIVFRFGIRLAHYAFVFCLFVFCLFFFFFVVVVCFFFVFFSLGFTFSILHDLLKVIVL